MTRHTEYVAISPSLVNRQSWHRVSAVAMSAGMSCIASAGFTFSHDTSSVRAFTDTGSPPAFVEILPADLGSTPIENGISVYGTFDDGLRTDRAFAIRGSEYLNGANGTGSRMVASGLITSGTLDESHFIRGDFDLFASLEGASDSAMSISGEIRLEFFADSAGLKDYITGFSMGRGLPGLGGGESSSLADVFDTETIGDILGVIPDFTVARWSAEVTFHWTNPADDDTFTVYIPTGSVDYLIIPCPATAAAALPLSLGLLGRRRR